MKALDEEFNEQKLQELYDITKDFLLQLDEKAEKKVSTIDDKVDVLNAFLQNNKDYLSTMYAIYGNLAIIRLSNLDLYIKLYKMTDMVIVIENLITNILLDSVIE